MSKFIAFTGIYLRLKIEIKKKAEIKFQFKLNKIIMRSQLSLQIVVNKTLNLCFRGAVIEHRSNFLISVSFYFELFELHPLEPFLVVSCEVVHVFVPICSALFFGTRLNIFITLLPFCHWWYNFSIWLLFASLLLGLLLLPVHNGFRTTRLNIVIIIFGDMRSHIIIINVCYLSWL